MSDQPMENPQFVDDAPPVPRPVRGMSRSVPRVPANTQPAERKITFLATIDYPMLVIVGMLLALGLMMVYSTTFFWSDSEWGRETILLERHAQNMGFGLIAMVVFMTLNYRILRRMAVIIMLMAVSFLIAVLIFGDDTFGARRALINGRFQPGEFSELAIIIYMSAWLGSKNMRIRSLTYGFLPFAVLVGIVGALVIAQPDLSTAVVIFLVSGLMFFLAGADMRQIALSIGAIMLLVFVAISAELLPEYAVDRISSYTAGVRDLTQTSYHTQQGLIAISYGGWTGVGLGAGEAKFNNTLPAPHTDSIFAVIGEELGVLGTGAVLLLYIIFVLRGFQISRRAPDAFGALMVAGVTVWVATKAVLNIAVMTALLPPTGLPLPFISFGGSSMVVLLAGVGMLLSVHRFTVLQKQTADRREVVASIDRGRGNGRTRLPRTRRSGSTESTIR